uniref:Uncharacterized protein n=1 Tax=Kalanchoe fedtschenkoi TaxID=63787 RepID=A0A7N0UTG3_KALFE
MLGVMSGVYKVEIFVKSSQARMHMPVSSRQICCYSVLPVIHNTNISCVLTHRYYTQAIKDDPGCIQNVTVVSRSSRHLFPLFSISLI